MKTGIRPRGVRFAAAALGAGVLLGACTVMPTGPSVMALPGSRKNVDEYQADIAACQQYANAVIAAHGGTAAAADGSAASTAAAGALVGAATGAIIGSATGQASQGAAIGAGTGLVFGAAAGSTYTSMSSWELQRGYDSAYLQCMYARGNKVPTAPGRGAGPSRPVYLDRNPAPASYPPPNTPPPPGLTGSGYPPPNTPPPPGLTGSGYPPPANVPPSSYPPPNTPPPAGLPPGK
jgi:hypothetical protein